MSAKPLTLINGDDGAAGCQIAGRTGVQLPSRISQELATLLEAPDASIQLPEDQIHALLAEIARLHVELAAGSTRLLAELLARRAARDHPAADRLLTAEQAAAELGVNVRWIQRRTRTLPFVRPLSGKAIRVSEESLRRWIANRRAA